MKREVIQDFLNLPGIAGVALMDGRSRPYFYGVDQALNFQQKEALAQGIQQVVDTTPDGFGSFEFQFTGHQVYIYKLKHGIILLVLAGEKLINPQYRSAVTLLQNELQKDPGNAIATFRLLAGNVTLTQQNHWATQSKTPAAESTPPSPAPPPQAQNGAHAAKPNLQPSPPLPPPPPVEPEAPPSAEPLTIKEILTALNQISEITSHYLGNIVVANYWKTSRPASDWLQQFDVDRSANFSFKAATPASAQQPLESEQQQWVREWIAAFIERCSKVIRDFSDMLHQSALDDRLKALLPPD